jgi:hypothetical protein
MPHLPPGKAVRLDGARGDCEHRAEAGLLGEEKQVPGGRGGWEGKVEDSLGGCGEGGDAGEAGGHGDVAQGST